MQPNLAKQFIAQLETQGLLAPDIIDELRRQVAESKSRLTPEVIAKLLVDNGHLTKFQATRLIAELKASSEKLEPKSQPETKKPKPGDDEDLGFAPDPDSKTRKSDSTVFIDEDVVEVVENDVMEVEVVEEVVAAPTATPVAKPVRAPRSRPAADSFLDESLPVLSTQIKRQKIAKANPLDSFRILGVGIILALVLVAGVWLVWWFYRGNATEILGRADAAYEQRSYETAAAIYKDFGQNFGTDPKASYAKVRGALAALRKDTENAADPNVGLKTALEVLPPIAGESALSSEQGDLTGVLLNLAGKFTERADGLKETAEKKTLMVEMDKLMELVNNPQFVGTTQRNQQLPTINRIDEDRQRILRDINRDEDLVKTLAAITEKLDGKQTGEAYQLRKELINRYPQLETDSGLNALVQKATVIQKALVESASPSIKLTSDAPVPQPARAMVLANRAGGEAVKLKGRTLFIRAKGSIYGMDGQSGNVLWRYYVGQDLVDDPIRLRDTAASDVVVSRPDRGHFVRLDGATGKAKWHVDLGSPAHRAVVDGEDMLVAVRDGTLANLDVGQGQTKWAVKLPQLLEVCPGVSTGKPHLYIPGEHSNLYALSRQDGSCKEVYYLGHRRGTIVVPPLLLLGQLFVFENAGADYSMIRVLQTTDGGLELAAAQKPIRLKGHVVVPPQQIDGRRVIVLTDLGEIVVLDIEPTATKEKVSSIASIPASESSSRVAWAVADKNTLWISSYRFIRYDIQVSGGRLLRQWIEEDGDQFTGASQKYDEVIVHTRTVRGTQGVRVSAVAAESGKPFWLTDIAVPVSAIVESGQTGVYDAITSSAMVYAVDGKPLRNSADVNPEEGKPATLYRNPEALADGTQVMFNSASKNRMAVYAPKTPKRIQTFAVSFAGAEPTCPPTSIGDKLVVGLSNGQLTTVSPVNGAISGTPYQVTMQPGRVVVWNQPAYFEDSQSLVATSNLQKLMRIGVGDGLRKLSEIDLEQPFLGPLVALGNKVVGVTASQTADTLRFFDATSLKQDVNAPLAGHVIAGPFSTAGCVLVQTEANLEALDSSGKSLWTMEFPKSRIVGKPAMAGDNIIVASAAGQIWSIDPKSGATVAKSSVNHPLSAAPLVLPKGLLLGSDEGCVLVIPPLTPASEAKQ